jgi:hypothetical protein
MESIELASEDFACLRLLSIAETTEANRAGISMDGGAVELGDLKISALQ